MQRPIHSFEKTAKFEPLVESLRNNGVALIRGFLDEDIVAGLKAEVRDLVQREHKNRLAEGQSMLGRYSMDELQELEKQTVLSLGEHDLLNRIAQDFFTPYAPDLHKVYCHHDVDRMAFNNDWHFDRGLTLKFFYYLNDVSTRNGAFWYDLGSHRSNAVKQHLWWEANMPILNYVPEREVTIPTPMEGPAGSLIIFDASGYHEAGTIEEGTERWVVRYHIRAGARTDDGKKDRNPYARRNWAYRSACYTTREDEKDAPWSPMPGKEAAAKPAAAAAEVTGNAKRGLLGRLSRVVERTQ